MPWVELISLSRCRPGAGTFVAWHDRELAVFPLRDPGRVVVIDNACPHAGGNLSGGDLQENRVQCPWHHWEFDLDRGVSTHSPLAMVRGYPAEVRDGMVWFDPG